MRSLLAVLLLLAACATPAHGPSPSPSLATTRTPGRTVWVYNGLTDGVHVFLVANGLPIRLGHLTAGQSRCWTVSYSGSVTLAARVEANRDRVVVSPLFTLGSDWGWRWRIQPGAGGGGHLLSDRATCRARQT